MNYKKIICEGCGRQIENDKVYRKLCGTSYFHIGNSENPLACVDSYLKRAGSDFIIFIEVNPQEEL